MKNKGDKKSWLLNVKHNVLQLAMHRSSNPKWEWIGWDLGTREDSLSLCNSTHWTSG